MSRSRQENLCARKFPGFTEKELNITCEPGRRTITGKKEIKEEPRMEKKEEMPIYTEKANIDKTVKLPVEVKTDNVKATLRNGILEVTLPKGEVVKRVKIEVKPL